MTLEILAGIAVPFIGTTLGAVAVLLCKKTLSPLTGKLLCGFAAGVMLAASIWSLIMPSVEMAEKANIPSFLPASVGFILGMAALALIDKLVPIGKDGSGELRKTKLMVFAVTVHNIPEGMAVGAVLAGLMAGESITFAAAISLSIGIALQNIPEGAIVGLPLVAAGKSKGKAFAAGVLSGAVEPIAALITIALYVVVVAVLPYLLAFAAGAMIYVVVKELVPELGESTLAVLALCAGFVIMMAMDLSL